MLSKSQLERAWKAIELSQVLFFNSLNCSSLRGENFSQLLFFNSLNCSSLRVENFSQLLFFKRCHATTGRPAPLPTVAGLLSISEVITSARVSILWSKAKIVPCGLVNLRRCPPCSRTPSNETHPQSSQLRYVHVPSNVNWLQQTRPQSCQLITTLYSHEMRKSITKSITKSIQKSITKSITKLITKSIEKSPTMLKNRLSC